MRRRRLTSKQVFLNGSRNISRTLLFRSGPTFKSLRPPGPAWETLPSATGVPQPASVFPSPAASVQSACCLELPDGSSPRSSACVRTAQPSDRGARSGQCICALPTPVQAVQAVLCLHGAWPPSSAVPVRAAGGHLSPVTPTQEGVQPNSWNRDLLVPVSRGLAPGSLGCHPREGCWLEENPILV